MTVIKIHIALNNLLLSLLYQWFMSVVHIRQDKISLLAHKEFVHYMTIVFCNLVHPVTLTHYFTTFYDSTKQYLRVYGLLHPPFKPSGFSWQNYGVVYRSAEWWGRATWICFLTWGGRTGSSICIGFWFRGSLFHQHTLPHTLHTCSFTLVPQCSV